MRYATSAKVEACSLRQQEWPHTERSLSGEERGRAACPAIVKGRLQACPGVAKVASCKTAMTAKAAYPSAPEN
jgi:hypothetical protein